MPPNERDEDDDDDEDEEDLPVIDMTPEVIDNNRLRD